MNVLLAWRILTHQKGRTALALVGIFMAILLVFIQLGLFYAVPQGGMLLYDNMRFDLLLVSDQYEYQAQPGAFALSRLDRVRAAADVAAATPIYFGLAKWKGGEGGVWPDLFVIGFDPPSHVFAPPSIDRQLGELARPDTILVDSATRPMFGPLTPGRVVDIGDRAETIGGQYVLGTGFMGLGVALASEANFARLFPGRGLGQVNLGLIRLKPGVDPDRAAAALRQLLGAGTQIFTRRELASRETAYWTTRTSVGLIFGSGLLISIVVGIMVVYQIVSTQVSRQLPQFATLKAIGYGDGALAATVAAMSLLIVAAGFVPAAGRRRLGLPGDPPADPAAGDDDRRAMPPRCWPRRWRWRRSRRLLALGGLRRADPADVF